MCVLHILRELLTFQVLFPNLMLIQGQANGLSDLCSLRALHRFPWGWEKNHWEIMVRMVNAGTYRVHTPRMGGQIKNTQFWLTLTECIRDQHKIGKTSLFHQLAPSIQIQGWADTGYKGFGTVTCAIDMHGVP